jgi:steroid 5-alpha reductase family enzyme
MTLVVALSLWSLAWWLVSLRFKRMDVADVAWGLGFVLIALITWLHLETFDLRATVVTAMVTVWGIRLAWHIGRRNLRKTEDPRYAAWRADWGTTVLWRSFLQVFVLQTVLLVIVAMPILAVNGHPAGGWGFFDTLGLLLFLYGFGMEIVADKQLADFLRDPSNKGKVLDTGVWATSRHPNYFGEVTLWWGIGLMSVAGGWWALIGPAAITYLILYVSGVPMLERKMALDPKYADYLKTTSRFIPRKPRTDA